MYVFPPILYQIFKNGLHFLKQADAMAEIEAFRAELQQKVEADNKQNTSAGDDTEAKSRQICATYQSQYNQNKAAAQNKIMSWCLDVKL